MTINFQSETNEILEINNLVYTIMPSDITMFTDNALIEEVYFRSKGAFAFRSKHSTSEVTLTFPVPLLDPTSLDSYSDTQKELFTNGIDLMAQLNGFPFCFVRSARIHSYLGVSYQTPNEYLMFGIKELQIIQDARISDTLMIQATLILNNHTNLVKTLRFVSDYKIDHWNGISIDGSVDDIKDSKVFGDFMASLTGDALGNYTKLLREIGVITAQGNFKKENSFTNLVVKCPYVAGEDQLRLVDNNSRLILDIDDEEAPNIEYSDFKMYDRFSGNDKTFDGASLEEFQSKDIEDLDVINNKEQFLKNWRMYYLADNDLFHPSINAIQSITLIKTNSFVPHHIGSSQHPYLQFMGKYPARMQIVSLYNNTGSYEFNQKSTMNLFRVLLNSLDTNNTIYPGANAFNYLKIKSVAGAILGIENMMPGECTLVSSSESSNTEVFTTSFVENSLNFLIDDSKVRVGREIVSSKRQVATMKAIVLYVNAIKAAISNKTLEQSFSYDTHMPVMKDLAILYEDLVSEIGGDGQNGDEVDIKLKDGTKAKTKSSAEKFAELTQSTANKATFLKMLPYAFEVVILLNKRVSVNEFKMNQGDKNSKKTGVEGTVSFEKDGVVTTQTINETYNFNSRATDTIDKISQKINYLASIGFIRLQQSEQMELTSTKELNDQFLKHSFVGDSQRDLNLDKYEPNVYFRKFLDPFFFVDAPSIVNQKDFYDAFDIIGTEAVKNITKVVSREINADGGVLSGSEGNSNELIAEMELLKESRYVAREGAIDPTEHDEDEGSGKSDYNINVLGSLNKYNLGQVKPWVASAASILGTMFNIKTVYGIGTRANKSDHPLGLGLDFMCSQEQGNKLAAFAIIHYEKLNIKYVIWWQRIWQPGKGWKAMEDRGGITANHKDHVHISFLATPINSDFSSFVSGGVGGTAYNGPPPDLSKLPNTPLTSTAGLRLGIYKSLRNAGFNDNQSRILTAEIGREGSFIANSVFGYHTDDANKATNAGMISWQGKRNTRLMKFLRGKGVITGNSTFQRTQANLNAQAQYIRWEMENDGSYSETKRKFLNVPNVSYQVAVEVLGRNYIAWASTVSKYSNGHTRRNQHYMEINAQLKGVPTGGTATPKGNNNGSPKPTNKPANKPASGTAAPQTGLPKYYKPTNPVPTREISAKVIYVLDGDSFLVQSKDYMGNKLFEVRLHAADAPEIFKTNTDGSIKSPSQFYGPDSKAYADSVLYGKYVHIKLKKIIGNRIEGDIRITGNKRYSEIIVGLGSAYSTGGDTMLDALQRKAKENKIGMWKQADRTMLPTTFRNKIPTDKKYLSDQQPKGVEKPAASSTEKAAAQAPSSGQGAVAPVTSTASGTKIALTNNFVGVDSAYVVKVLNTYGERKKPNNALNKAQNTVGNIEWHNGMDVQAKAGGPVRAPCSGTISVGKNQWDGNYVILHCDAQGFKCKFLYLASVTKTSGKVVKGDQIGVVGNTGLADKIHLHYEVHYNDIPLNPKFTADLNIIPTFKPLVAGHYIAKEALHSATGFSSGVVVSKAAGAADLYKGTIVSQSESMATLGGTEGDISIDDIRGYTIEDVIMDTQMSVFDESLQVVKHVEKMYSNFERGLNISFPIVKAYAVVGNESDDVFTSEVPLKPSIYFELPTLNNLNVSTNNDLNPIDVCTFSMVNPNSTRSSSEFYGDSSFGSNVYNLDSQYYNLFYADRIKLKPGMKIHIKAGYSNSPGKLSTIFNGIITEVSGTQDLLLQVICESYSAELLSNSMGYEKPFNLSNGKNASTGLLIAYSLLEENISHFGSRPTEAKVWLTYTKAMLGFLGDTLATVNPIAGYTSVKNANENKEESENQNIAKTEQETPNTIEAGGDYRDPENKALVSPLNPSDLLGAWNPSRANLSQRLFTNIYSDAIEAAHNQYKSNLWTRVSMILEFMDSKMFYKYFVFRSTSWSILKEMEYRHPGTLAKPLWYDERMTMFFGIKEQLYIAKDLTPVFMFQAGRAGLFKNVHQPYTADYLTERHKRLEPATGFHMLSSKLNIINNNLTLSRDFATRVNVMYYEKKYEGNKMQPKSESFKIDLDDNIAPFDIREETISLNGCHGEYMSWMYGIQELKKQMETMYRGSITITGKADVRAGDYAYLEDADRGMSGVIKIRECTHQFSPEVGFITVITPGLHVECTQFYWSSLFTQLGMASKMTLMKADLSVNNLLTTNKVADSYYNYLKIIQSAQDMTMSNAFFGVGGSVAISALNLYFLHKLASKSSVLKRGLTAAEFAKYWDDAAFIARTTGSYSKFLILGSIDEAIAARTALKQAEVARLAANGITVNPGVAANVATKIKNISAMKNFGILKMIAKVPWGALKGVLSVGTVIVRGLLGAVAATPIGAALFVVGTIMFSAVLSKFKEIGLTHNPLLMFPIMYNGKPYIAGITGYENNSILDGALTNLKRNINAFKKSSHALRVTTQGTSTTANAVASGIEVGEELTTLIQKSAEAVAEYVVSSDGNAEY